MSNLPFSTSLTVPPNALTGYVRIRLFPDKEGSDEELTRDDYAGALSLLALFAQAVNAQLLTAHAEPITAMAVDSCDWNHQNQCCEMVCHVENIQPYAWVYLLALLQKNHDTLEPLASVSIATHAISNSLSIDTLIQQVPRKLHQGDIGFIWDTSGIDKSKNLHIDLEFVSPIKTDVLQRVESGLIVWLQLIILGAFDFDFAAASDLDPLGTVKATSSIRVECFVPYLQGDMTGLVVLENLLRDIHFRRQALREVTLD